MRLKAVTLFCGFSWLWLIKLCQSARWSQHCDNGKVKLETDLPQSDELACPEPWPQSPQRLADLSTKYPLQPAEQICMNMTIKYNQTIPSSGAHRPVGALSGEYLYCPPQRWLNNLKDGAIVLLYHPCASEIGRRALAATAHSCLHHYILTAHPQLSQHRPFALVSWGYTLEMSHVTSAGVCDWLLAAFSNFNQTKEGQRPKYSLYLTKAAPVDRVLGTTVKSLRACCVEALSVYEQSAARTKSRRSLDAHQSNKSDEAMLSQNSPAQNSSESKILNSTHTQSLNITEDKEVPPETPHPEQHSYFLHTATPEKPEERTTATYRITMKAPSPDHVKGDAATKSLIKTPESGLSSHKKTKLKVHKHRIKTDTEEQGGERGGGCGAPGQCTAPNTAAPKKSGPLQSHRMPTARTDEAVWAAAALGFLLVLLTLSVLHTRLYRNWRTPPSLYWRETQQDYESVADIIRRRLRMVGRRKRRSSQSRRQECPLLPDSSTDNDSD
ncbi:tumor protein p53-inducible protein 13 [Astyanax mexicanus]|uniref:Tumor protein p53-inducible protein 13 n=1 Tax=Astyanax mexicanus TaxID=7994 RepID=A0A8B9J587_ASTMX|nr:tumor protein p53-inducible protein 13 [Astyanax mexicanus]